MDIVQHQHQFETDKEWVLVRVWSRDLQKYLQIHEDFEYQLYSNLHLCLLFFGKCSIWTSSRAPNPHQVAQTFYGAFVVSDPLPVSLQNGDDPDAAHPEVKVTDELRLSVVEAKVSENGGVPRRKTWTIVAKDKLSSVIRSMIGQGDWLFVWGGVPDVENGILNLNPNGGLESGSATCHVGIYHKENGRNPFKMDKNANFENSIADRTRKLRELFYTEDLNECIVQRIEPNSKRGQTHRHHDPIEEEVDEQEIEDFVSEEEGAAEEPESDPEEIDLCSERGAADPRDKTPIHNKAIDSETDDESNHGQISRVLGTPPNTTVQNDSSDDDGNGMDETDERQEGDSTPSNSQNIDKNVDINVSPEMFNSHSQGSVTPPQAIPGSSQSQNQNLTLVKDRQQTRVSTQSQAHKSQGQGDAYSQLTCEPLSLQIDLESQVFSNGGDKASAAAAPAGASNIEVNQEISNPDPDFRSSPDPGHSPSASPEKAKSGRLRRGSSSSTETVLRGEKCPKSRPSGTRSSAAAEEEDEDFPDSQYSITRLLEEISSPSKPLKNIAESNSKPVGDVDVNHSADLDYDSESTSTIFLSDLHQIKSTEMKKLKDLRDITVFHLKCSIQRVHYDLSKKAVFLRVTDGTLPPFCPVDFIPSSSSTATQQNSMEPLERRSLNVDILVRDADQFTDKLRSATEEVILTNVRVEKSPDPYSNGRFMLTMAGNKSRILCCVKSEIKEEIEEIENHEFARTESDVFLMNGVPDDIHGGDLNPNQMEEEDEPDNREEIVENDHLGNLDLDPADEENYYKRIVLEEPISPNPPSHRLSLSSKDKDPVPVHVTTPKGGGTSKDPTRSTPQVNPNGTGIPISTPPLPLPSSVKPINSTRLNSRIKGNNLKGGFIPLRECGIFLKPLSHSFISGQTIRLNSISIPSLRDQISNSNSSRSKGKRLIIDLADSSESEDDSSKVSRKGKESPKPSSSKPKPEKRMKRGGSAESSSSKVNKNQKVKTSEKAKTKGQSQKKNAHSNKKDVYDSDSSSSSDTDTLDLVKQKAKGKPPTPSKRKRKN